MNPFLGVGLTPFKDPETDEPVKFMLVNQDSRVFYNAFNAMNAEHKAHFEKTKQVMTVEQIQGLTTRLIASMVIGWNLAAVKFFEEELGPKAPWSPESVIQLLENPEYFWVVNQIEEFLKDKSRFFQNQ